MTTSPERLHDLLADQALEGLSPEEARELEALLAEHSASDLDLVPYELAAAASALAFLPAEGAGAAGLEPMPEQVEREILERARAFVVAQAAQVTARAPAATPPAATARVLPIDRPMAKEVRPAPRWRHAGWWAAAACLALAVAGWWDRVVLAPIPAPVTVERAEQPAPASPEERLAQAPDRVAIPWQATKDPDAATAQGEVVWSTGLQQGYMRFRGLPANDPTKNQYQLWIFDANQDERYPIDGGVFDVPAGQTEVVVPIDPRLRVVQPTLFAVTVEKPGGVVVSSRERIVVVAPRA